MKTLILTEKPSVARDFAHALGVTPHGAGYFENQDTIITWAIGHLMELKSPEDYDSKWKRWTLESMPILPERLLYQANPKTRKQLTSVLAQLKRSDLKRIILATDAGREGELIGRTLINESKTKVASFRFWTSQALSSSVINEELAKITPLKNYDRLYFAGRARQSADWLVGMNLSRLATLKMGDLFSVGRVQTAVLALIVNRAKEIEGFNPIPYYTIASRVSFESEKLEINWFDPTKKKNERRLETKDQVNEVIKSCQGHEVIVKEVLIEQKHQSSPQLFSLTELQKTANRLYGFSAKKTLDLAQELYEKNKCLSYPRTDARVLGTKSLSQAKEMIGIFSKSHPQYFKFYDEEKLSLKNTNVFNDAKLTDHHALIPLKKASLNGDGEKIYELVLKRFIMVFSKDYQYQQTRIKFQIGMQNFKARGLVITCMGWKELSGGDKDLNIPKLIKDQRGQVTSLDYKENKTRPPLLYTEATLLQDMINPGRLVDEVALKKAYLGDIGLGTQATRAQIIETLLQRNYIKRSEKNLVALTKGIKLIVNLQGMELSKVLTNPKETAKWELELEEIARGSGNPRMFMLAIREFVLACSNEWKEATFTHAQKSRKEDCSQAIAKCPICQSSVIESPKSYGCSMWRDGCKFKIWKRISGKKISMTQAKKIINQGSSDQLKGFKSKAGKSFDATLVLDGTGVKFSFNETN